MGNQGMDLFIEHGGFLWHCRVALGLPGLRFGAAVAGWRCAYPAYGSVLLCRVALRLPGLRFGAAVPGGASLTRPTVRGR
ncbi:hypothetical protein GNG27_03160 [Leclercia sp. 119287]|uniref:hypothetical protein n=1 Tax=Leclercia sp. 119287 TaxID=2681308 RepID=UPI0012E279C1|nr:hypothetical protein [Leclercia sp. 119287]QGU13710.1 hypothetical protein GNG27_03160 [Leclercia sp. 119287]